MLKFLKNLFRSKQPKTLSHSFFGELLFIDSLDPAQGGYWEGDIVIDNTQTISIAIHAPEEGPQTLHEQFWESVVSDFDKVIEKCHDVMKQEYEEWTEKSYPVNFSDEFIWEGIMIPKEGNENYEWDITFICKSDPDHTITVYFENGKAICASVDG